MDRSEKGLSQMPQGTHAHYTIPVSDLAFLNQVSGLMALGKSSEKPQSSFTTFVCCGSYRFFRT